MRTLLQILLTASLLQSCQSGTKQHLPETTQNKDTVIDDKTTAATTAVTASGRILLPETLQVRQLPTTDSTNFDNVQKTGIPAAEFIKRIGFHPGKPAVKDYRLNYSIPISKNFATLSITYQSGDHELFTILLTLNSDNEIIDTLEIAYDEIAESAFRKMSKITPDKIVVTSINWMGEEPIYESSTYAIQSDGKFMRN